MLNLRLVSQNIRSCCLRACASPGLRADSFLGCLSLVIFPGQHCVSQWASALENIVCQICSCIANDDKNQGVFHVCVFVHVCPVMKNMFMIPSFGTDWLPCVHATILRPLKPNWTVLIVLVIASSVLEYCKFSIYFHKPWISPSLFVLDDIFVYQVCVHVFSNILFCRGTCTILTSFKRSIGQFHNSCS